MKKSIYSIALCTVVALGTGCSANLDKNLVQAQAGSPQSTQAEVINIPYNPSLPKYVLAVEPFVFRETIAAGTEVNFRYGGEDLAAKLTTALGNVGNFSIIDSGLSKTTDGKYHAKINKGESGPYIVKATVSEFTENAEAEEKSRGVSLGSIGLIAGIAGALTGKSGLAWAGAGVAAADPGYSSETSMKKGMVGIDFRVVNGSTGRIIKTFKSTGTFTSASASKGVSLFGISGGETKFAQSVLGQAVTQAMNDAVQQIADSLSVQVKTARK